MEEYEEDIIDEAEDDLDESQDLQDGQLEQLEGTLPSNKEQHNIYNWFWRVVRMKDPLKSIKVGNLFNTEIGDLQFSVRDSMNIAYLGELFGHQKFGEYFKQHALVTSVSSMARKGWFMDLSISQKKVRERSKQQGSLQSGGKEKWRLFQGKKQQKED